MPPTTTSCCNGATGPGFATPLDAMKNGAREKILYVPCVAVNDEASDVKRPDALATIDVDPTSQQFGQVIHMLDLPNTGDEVHHSGWNTCSSCFGDSTKSRDKLVLPCMASDRVYIIDVGADDKKPQLHTTVEPKAMHAVGLRTPHSTHCLGSGEIMISCMGDEDDVAKCGFFLVDGKNFEPIGEWVKDRSSLPEGMMGYDYWYQPYFNVMVSSEWGHPNLFKNGFDPKHVAEGKYGSHLHFWDWNERKLTQTLDLGPDGMVPLELRFLHDPKKAEGFVACALSSSVFRFFKDGDKWSAEKVIQVAPKTVTGWALPQMPGLITDILISLDDRFLYLSNWLHGDIRQYDITDTRNPKLVGQLFLGGSLVSDDSNPVKITEDPENADIPPAFVHKGEKLTTSPQMLQLSLDGERLYATSSLFTVWDKQFYPEMVKRGAHLFQIDVNTSEGGLKLNPELIVDFGRIPDRGPYMAHEVRYPGGDCTSDIWLAPQETD